MKIENIILQTDSYKYSHYLQYPPKTEIVFSYIESRGGKYAKTVFFGLQAFLKEYLTKPITQEMVDEAKEKSAEAKQAIESMKVIDAVKEE